MLPSQTAESADSVKYLDIYRDKYLMCDTHFQQFKKRFTKWLVAVPNLGNSASRVPPIDVAPGIHYSLLLLQC